jgi:hypothetical protein
MPATIARRLQLALDARHGAARRPAPRCPDPPTSLPASLAVTTVTSRSRVRDALGGLWMRVRRTLQSKRHRRFFFPLSWPSPVRTLGAVAIFAAVTVAAVWLPARARTLWSDDDRARTQQRVA